MQISISLPLSLVEQRVSDSRSTRFPLLLIGIVFKIYIFFMLFCDVKENIFLIAWVITVKFTNYFKNI